MGGHRKDIPIPANTNDCCRQPRYATGRPVLRKPFKTGGSSRRLPPALLDDVIQEATTHLPGSMANTAVGLGACRQAMEYEAGHCVPAHLGSGNTKGENVIGQVGTWTSADLLTVLSKPCLQVNGWRRRRGRLFGTHTKSQ